LLLFSLQTLYKSFRYDIIEHSFPFGEGEYLCSSINPTAFVSIQLKTNRIDQENNWMRRNYKKEQRKLSRRALHAKNNSINPLDAKNYQKQKIRVARLHEKVMNQLKDCAYNRQLKKKPSRTAGTAGVAW